MPSNSVGYIFGFCAAVCLACSVIVSTAAVGLKEMQEQNKILDRQKKVLTVAGLMKEGEAIAPKDVQSIFKKRIKSVVVQLASGNIDSKVAPETFDQQKAKSDPSMSRPAPKNLAGLLRLPKHALVYLVSKDDMSTNGEGFQLSQYIFPVEGKGLWSTLYGFLALAPNFNEIRGLTFYQHAETPGLGGEVDNPSWKAKWLGRLLFGPKGSLSTTWKKPKVEVIKGIAGAPEQDPHKVDGLSGATITSKGVTYLVHFWMGKNGFGPFIQKQLKRKEDHVQHGEQRDASSKESSQPSSARQLHPHSTSLPVREKPKPSLKYNKPKSFLAGTQGTTLPTTSHPVKKNTLFTTKPVNTSTRAATQKSSRGGNNE